MPDVKREIRERLLELADGEYRDFHAKLIPNVDRSRIIGVRTPQVKRLAAELSKRDDIEDFLNDLPHEYYDENNVHGFIICKIRSYEECVAAIDRFLPFVDNWATCDLLSPSVFKRNTDRLEADVRRWIETGRTYTVRFGLGMLLKFFLDGAFDEKYLETAADVPSGEYYVDMMRAWLFATALAKRYDAALPYIENRRLDIWTHNRTIQKAVESYRLDDGRKEYLRRLRIKTARGR